MLGVVFRMLLQRRIEFVIVVQVPELLRDWSREMQFHDQKFGVVPEGISLEFGWSYAYESQTISIARHHPILVVVSWKADRLLY